MVARAADSQVGLEKLLTWSTCEICPCGSTVEEAWEDEEGARSLER